MAAYAVLYITAIEDLSLILKEFKDNFNCKIDKNEYGYSIYIKASKEDILRLQHLILEEGNNKP